MAKIIITEANADVITKDEGDYILIMFKSDYAKEFVSGYWRLMSKSGILNDCICIGIAPTGLDNFLKFLDASNLEVFSF
jgi:hypothetical protein